MSTKQPRINVTFDTVTVGLLSTLATNNHQSLASLVRELTLEALALHEDKYLSQLAESRDKKGAATYDHDKAWS